MSKVIVIDWGMVLHRSGYAMVYNRDIPPTYTAMNSVLSYLNKIGVTKEDKIIIACDGRGNWRRAYTPEIKGDREAVKKKSGLDWDKIYKDFDWLLNRLFKSTGWGIVKLNEIEADDVASIICKYTKNQEVVLVSVDMDWEFLWTYPNVKIFSPLKKYKGKKGAYKIKPSNFNPHKMLTKMIIKKGKENLKSEITNIKDYENRKIVVDLINLPSWVENKILETLKKLKFNANFNSTFIPFPNSIGKRIENIYDGKRIVTYEQCVAFAEYKKEKKKNGRKNKRTNKRPIRSK